MDNKWILQTWAIENVIWELRILSQLESQSNYRIFISHLIEPFSIKFWLENSFLDRDLNITFDDFQKMILKCWNYEHLEVFLDIHWYKLKWIKKIDYKIEKKRSKYIFLNYVESWDSFDTNNILNKAKDWNAFFWFLPLSKQDDKILLVYAELKENPIQNTQVWINNIIN